MKISEGGRGGGVPFERMDHAAQLIQGFSDQTKVAIRYPFSCFGC